MNKIMMNILKEHSKSDNEECLIFACETGDLEQVKYLLTSEEVINKATGIDYGFTSACEHNHFDIVKYLLTSPELSTHAQINKEYVNGFFETCTKGHFDIMRYLLTSSDLKEHANIHTKKNYQAIINACYCGNLEIIKYVLASPEIKDHFDIHTDKDDLFQTACRHGHLDIVDFLCTSTELKEHANVNVNKCDVLVSASLNGHLRIIKYLLNMPSFKYEESIGKAFRNACRGNQLEVVHYLIFEFGISHEIYVAEHLNNYPYVKELNIEKLFTKRVLINKLNETMNKKDILKRVKI